MYAILNNENWLCRDRVLLKFLDFTEILLFPRAMSQVPCLHEHLANAARVKYPAACGGYLTLRSSLQKRWYLMISEKGEQR